MLDNVIDTIGVLLELPRPQSVLLQVAYLSPKAAARRATARLNCQRRRRHRQSCFSLCIPIRRGQPLLLGCGARDLSCSQELPRRVA